MRKIKKLKNKIKKKYLWRKYHDMAHYFCKGNGLEVGALCYPYLFNDPAFTERNISAAQEYLGIENVVNLDLWMASEDFSFYSQNVEGCFYRLGTRNETKSIISGVHTPDFNIDEDAIKIGMGLMSWLTIQELNH